MSSVGGGASRGSSAGGGGSGGGGSSGSRSPPAEGSSRGSTPRPLLSTTDVIRNASKHSTVGQPQISLDSFLAGRQVEGPVLTSLFADGQQPKQSKRRSVLAMRGPGSAEDILSQDLEPAADAEVEAEEADQGDGPPPPGRFDGRPAEWRRRVLRVPWRLPVTAMHLAATVIQKAWRGCWLRLAKPSLMLADPPPGIYAQIVAHASTSQHTSGSVGSLRSSLPSARKPPGQGGSAAAATALRQRYFDLLRRQCDERAYAASGYRSFPVKVYPSYEHFCAAVLQGRWQTRQRIRMVHRVQRYHPYKLYHVAAFEIQQTWKRFYQRQRWQIVTSRGKDEAEVLRQYALRCQAAATRIQQAWVKVNSYRVYVSLRDTIASFRGTGDPSLILRSVLPREYMLLDPAMQVHVRFRLGGSRFPPSIYYKIYTHGAVCDLGAFAPRNYAAERDPRLASQVGERGGWYEREENNGWRPLATRLAPGMERAVDEVEARSARKLLRNFHHSRLKRRQDVERQRRQRTMDWMRKLYGLAPESTAALEDGDFTPRPADADRTADQAAFAVGAPAGPGGAVRLAAATGSTTSLGALSARSAASPEQEHQQQQQQRPEPRPPAGRPPSGRLGRRTQARALGRGEPVAPAADVSSRGPSPSEYSPTADAGEPLEEDVDDQKLLEWSQKLDFDSYMGTWQVVATSDASEGTLPLRTGALRHHPALTRVH